MLRLRPTEHELRIEIMPLIDVIFLLLTFFIYALVLMIRAEIVPMEMPAFVSGDAATATPKLLSISLDGQGQWFIDREPVAIEEIRPRLEAARAADPSLVIYLAAAAEGDRDRLPAFLDLYDRLAGSGLDLRLVGRPAE